MNLKDWLDAKRGRHRELSVALGVTPGRISQMAADGVPKAHLIAVRDFTGGEVSIEEMLESPPAMVDKATSPATPTESAA